MLDSNATQWNNFHSLFLIIISSRIHSSYPINTIGLFSLETKPHKDQRSISTNLLSASKAKRAAVSQACPAYTSTFERIHKHDSWSLVSLVATSRASYLFWESAPFPSKASNTYIFLLPNHLHHPLIIDEDQIGGHICLSTHSCTSLPPGLEPSF